MRPGRGQLAAWLLLALAGACRGQSGFPAYCPAGHYVAREQTQFQYCSQASDCPAAQPHCCGGEKPRSICVCDDMCSAENSPACLTYGLCDDPNDVPGMCSGGGGDRCGPDFGGAKCGGGGGVGFEPVPTYARYCNEDLGWCGDTDEHMNAQPSTAYDFVSVCDACAPGKFKLDKYAATFVATGCCNTNAANPHWQTVVPSSAFGDMMEYCTLNRDGTTTSDYQIEFCGCDVPPTTCVLQTAFTDPPCESCATGKFSAAGASACLDCPAGTESSPDNAMCNACAPGKFKSDKYVDTFVATGCCNRSPDTSWWQTQTASTVFGDMLSYCENARDGTGDAWRAEFCGCGSVPPTTCVLQTAFTDAFPDGLCKSCATGKYAAAGALACLDCPAGTFSSLDDVMCVACPSGTYSPASSGSPAACLCNMGYTGDGDGTPCYACLPGKFKEINGTGPCAHCPAGKYSAARGASTCLDCPEGSYNSTDNAMCVACPSGTYSPVSSFSPAACRCGMGFEGDGEVGCTACPVGKFKETDGSGTCMLCPKGQYTEMTGATSINSCVDCPDSYDGVQGGVPEVCRCTHAAVRAMALISGAGALGEAASYFDHATTYDCRYLWGPSYFSTYKKR